MISFEGRGSRGKHTLFWSLLRRPFTRVSAAFSGGSAPGTGSLSSRLDGTRLHVAIVGMALFLALAFALLVSMTVSSRSADAQVAGTFDQPQICDGAGLFSQGVTENNVAGTRFNSVNTEVVPFQFTRVSFQNFSYNALAYRAQDNFVYGYRSDNVNGNDNRGLIRIDRQGDIENYPTPAGLPKQTYSNAAIQQGTGLLYLYNNNGTTDINNDGFIENRQVYVVNLGNNTVSTFQTVNAQGQATQLNVIDFAFRTQDGLLYGADPNGNVVSLSPNTGLITRTAAGLPAATGYGGAFFNQNGDLFVIRNSVAANNFFQIDLDGAAPQIVSTNDVPSSASNDAAACYLPQQPDPNNPGQNIGRPYNADVKLTTQGPAQVDPGGPLTYTHTVLNSGPDNAPNVSVATTLPAGATYNPTGSGGTGWTCTAAPPNAQNRVVVTCSRTDELPLGNAPTLTVNATAPNGPVTGPLVANATATVADRNGEDSELAADEDDNSSTTNTNFLPTASADTYTATVGQTLNVNAQNGLLANDTDANGDTPRVVDGDNDANNGLSPVSGPTKGALTLNADGSFTYTPNAGASGTDTFTYRIGDGNGGTDEATVTINLNRPPDAVNNSYTVQTGETLTVNTPGILGNDTDPDNDPLTVVDANPNTPGVQPVTGPNKGTLTLNADGSFDYTPNAGATGTDTFTYRISDGNGGTDTATVTLNINRPPDAVDNTYTVQQGEPLTVNAPGILGNDTDPDGDTVRVIDGDGNAGNGISPVTAPTKGTVTLNANGTFTYTPNAGATGQDTFTYRIGDGNGGTDEATVTLNINRPPDAVNNSYTVQAGQPFTVDAPGILGNDTDPDGDTVRVVDAEAGTPGVQPVTGPNKGTLTLNADGSFTYTPNQGATGRDTFTYRIGDGNGGTDEATVTLNINQPPDAVNNSYTVQTGETLTVDAPGILGNDTDPEDDDLSVVDGDNDAGNGISPVTGPTKGTLTLNVDGSFEYTPNAGATGTDTFTYRISDGNGGFDTATVTLNINRPPIAEDDAYTTPFETELTGNVITNTEGGGQPDRDPDGDNVRVIDADPGTAGIQPVTGPANGTLTLNADGSFTYTPDDGFRGQDTFTYRIGDGNGGRDEATVTIDVQNAPPVAVDDTYTTPFETELTGNVITNQENGQADRDPNGDTLTVVDTDPNTAGVQPVTGPTNGTLTLNADGTFSYTPRDGFSGTDTFRYRISDGNGGTDTATVTITVPNAPPDAVNDRYTVQPGETLNVNAANGVLDNDTDPNTGPADTLRVVDGDGDANNGLSPVSGPTKGSLTLNADGSFTYTPNAGATGTDTFTYRISDGNGGTDEATVTLNLNRPPVAVDDVYAIPSTQPSLSDNVLTNVENGDQDSDPDNDTLTVVDGDNNPNNGISPVSGPANGTLTLNADGTFTYTPNPGFSGTDTFEYRISDGNGGFDVGEVFISVNGAPIARDDAYRTPFETPLQRNQNVITNPNGTDIDPDGDDLTANLVSGPQNAAPGSFQLNPDGTFTYTPRDGFSGTDTFTYTVTDENGETSNEATVTITVPNAKPNARNDRYRTPFNTTLNQGTPGILINDSDPNGDDDLTVADADPNTPGIQPVSGTRNGTLTLRADGSFKYVPKRGFSGTDTFTYRISDGNGGTDEATVTIVVDPKPAPKADLQIKVNSPERVDQGDRFKYTLTIKNNGPDGARNVRAVSKIPPGVEFVSAPKGCKYNASNRTVTCNVGNLSDNQVKKLQITVRAVKPGTVTLKGCYVRSDTADPNSSNNSDT